MEGAVKSLPSSIHCSADSLPISLDVVPAESLMDQLGFIKTFRSVASTLDRLLREYASGEISEPIVLAESISLENINPLAEAGGWSALVSMLVLAFPDIQWCFAMIKGESNNNPDNDKTGLLKALNRLHGLQCLDNSTPPCSNLFDGSGIRNAIRGSLNHDPAKLIKMRSHNIAVTIDDERQYSHLSGLVAYRFGYRCFPVDTFKLARELLGESGFLNGVIQLSIEDMNLRFPDNLSTPLSSAEDRLKEFPKLKGVKWLTLLTAAGAKKAKEHIVGRRIEVVGAGNDRDYRTVFKPIGGLNVEEWGFNSLPFTSQSSQRTLGFLNQPNSQSLPRWWAQVNKVLHLPQIVKWALSSGFESGSDGKDAAREPNLDAKGIDAPHSAPGRLVEVANVLLTRATFLCKLSDETKSPLPAIRAAVLAMDAKELLSNKTPTTCVTAIGARHLAEILAECQFAGVILTPRALRLRIQEITKEVVKVFPSAWHKKIDKPLRPFSLNWFYKHARVEWKDFWTGEGRQQDSALAGIVSRLLTTIDGRHQFEAELELLKEDRRLQNRIRWHQNIFKNLDNGELTTRAWYLKLWPFINFLGMRYVNWLLTGIGPLILASVFWLLLLSWPLIKFERPVENSIDFMQNREFEAIQYSVFTFLGIGQPNVIGDRIDHTVWFFTVSSLMLIGLFHLGILISQLYAVVSRR